MSHYIQICHSLTIFRFCTREHSMSAWCTSGWAWVNWGWSNNYAGRSRFHAELPIASSSTVDSAEIE